MAIENLSPASPAPSQWDTLSTDTSPEKQTKLPDLPTTSPNRICSFYIKEIERLGNTEAVKDFLETAINTEYETFSSEEELDEYCSSYSEELSSAISYDEKSALKRYTGFDYRLINQVARGQWDYNLLGSETPDKKSYAERSIETISEAIHKAPSPGKNLITYRGTNLDAFRRYGVNSMSDLANLKNQFYLERGYASTSIDRDSSFADRKDFDDPLRSDCDITIEYLIPAENHETIGLYTHETHCNPEQRELLIDADSLSYVSNVEVSKDKTSATLQMILIPRQIYDPATRQ